MWTKRSVGLFTLGLFLIVPFLLREVDRDLEPYPAILLPAGACLAGMGEPTISVTAVEAYVLDGHGALHHIQPKALLGRIPVQYFKPLAARHFGLEPRTWQGKWAARLGRDRDARWTAEDLAETRTWLFQRLVAAGFEDISALRIVKVSHVLDATDGSTVERILLDSYDIGFEVAQ